VVVPAVVKVSETLALAGVTGIAARTSMASRNAATAWVRNDFLEVKGLGFMIFLLMA